MTVAQLIADLTKMPQHAVVLFDGPNNDLTYRNLLKACPATLHDKTQHFPFAPAVVLHTFDGVAGRFSHYGSDGDVIDVERAETSREIAHVAPEPIEELPYCDRCGGYHAMTSEPC